MARRQRFDADYFPFFAKDGRTLTILQHKYQLAGIGFFTNVMRMLTLTPHHFVDLSTEADRLYAFSKIGCKPEEGIEMIEMMVTTGKLHEQLWRERSVVFCPDLCESLSELYRNRKSTPPTAEDVKSFLTKKTPFPRRKSPEEGQSNEETGVSSARNTQSRAEKTRETDPSKRGQSLSASDNSNDYPARASSPNGSPAQCNVKPPDLQSALNRLASGDPIRAGPE